MAVGWGLIGSSGYAANVCAPAIDAATNASLVAVLGSDAARAQGLADEYDARTGTDQMEEFLAAEGLDAVWIASPTYLHSPQGLAAMAAGKHVLLEKPFAVSSKEAWELCAVAAEAGLVLATGYQARYVPGHATMRDLIANGAIGDVTVARTYYGINRGGPPRVRRQHREMARWGVLGDTGTHHLDLLRMLLGEVTEASALTAHQGGFEVEDAAVAALKFASGAVAGLTVSMNAAINTTLVEVFGASGTLVARDTSPSGQGQVIRYGRDGSEEDVTGEQPSAFVAQVETVGRAVLGEQVAYASGEDGARNIEILEELVP